MGVVQGVLPQAGNFEAGRHGPVVAEEEAGADRGLVGETLAAVRVHVLARQEIPVEIVETRATGADQHVGTARPPVLRLKTALSIAVSRVESKAASDLWTWASSSKTSVRK